VQLARIRDGRHWPARSTFAYDPSTDALTFWYSGARYEDGRYIWSAAVERRRRGAIFSAAAAMKSQAAFKG
jgi:hypothetical protein